MCAIDRTVRAPSSEVSGRSSVSSSKNTIWFLPRAFAVIIAASAQAISSRGFIACFGPCAIPIETVTFPAGSRSISSSSSVRRLARPSAAASSHDGRITANSSPPSRQTTSEPRTVCESSLASAQSTSSPAPCPCTSLTRLKSSMSSISTETASCTRLARRSSERRRSWK